MTALKIGFVSTFAPRKCGIATYTSDLIKGLYTSKQMNLSPSVFAMDTTPQLSYQEPVKFKIRRDIKHDYPAAADCFNYSSIQLVSLQHEFGLFGGDAGSHLLLMLRRIRKPIVTTLHTVIETPSPEQQFVMTQLCQLSSKIVVMNFRGIRMLRDIYGVSSSKIAFIPHGIPDLPFAPTVWHKKKLGFENRKVILTFGLISPNKGIETMIEAMPQIVAADPSVLYVVLGAIHPEILRNHGRSYTDKLHKLVCQLGIKKNVLFLEKFVSANQLYEYLLASDIYVTPYLQEQQLTSGTLAFAVGSGRAVVSTPYWAAKELLAAGRGRLVPFASSKALADTITNLIANPHATELMRHAAWKYGRNMVWQKVAKQYLAVFQDQIRLARSCRDAVWPAAPFTSGSFQSA